MSKPAPRGVIGLEERERGTMILALPPANARRAGAPFQKARSPAGSRAMVNGS
jgi:hypothetical protein